MILHGTLYQSRRAFLPDLSLAHFGYEPRLLCNYKINAINNNVIVTTDQNISSFRSYYTIYKSEIILDAIRLVLSSK